MRRQLPVHSPIRRDALVAGGIAVLRGDRDGALRERLTALLRRTYSAADVVLADSGTSALQLALAGLSRELSGPVAMPAYACYDLITAARGSGVPVALYDVDPSTLGPDVRSLAGTSEHRPAAVVGAHLFGSVVDPAVLGDVVRGAAVIEDAAQGVGGVLRGRPLGSFGSLSVLSFGRGKGFTGGGGALLAFDDLGQVALNHARRLLDGSPARGGKVFAALLAQYLFGRPWVYGVPSSLPFLGLGETVYHPPMPPGPSTAASMAMVPALFGPSTAECEVRRRNAHRLLDALSRSRRATAALGRPDGSEPGFLRLPAVVPSSTRAGIVAGEGGRLGIAEGYPRALCDLPEAADILVNGDAPFPGARLLAERVITLPTHGLLAERDLTRLERWLAS